MRKLILPLIAALTAAASAAAKSAPADLNLGALVPQLNTSACQDVLSSNTKSKKRSNRLQLLELERPADAYPVSLPAQPVEARPAVTATPVVYIYTPPSPTRRKDGVRQ